MICVSFTAHNVTNHSLIPFPNTRNLLCHLKRFPAMIAALAVLWSAQLHLHAESPHGWDPQLEAHPKGDSDPGGPNDTQRIITNQKQ